MDDLISRSAAIEQIERREKLMTGDKRVGVEHFKTFLMNRPAIDAEPVRHGEWIPSSIDPYDPYFRCSVCNQGYSTIYHDGEEMNYCCNCGAKMDEEVQG